MTEPEVQFAEDTPDVELADEPGLFQKAAEVGKAAYDIGKSALGGAEATLEFVPKLALGMAAAPAAAGEAAVLALTQRGRLPTQDELGQKMGERVHQVTDWRLMDEARPTEEALQKGFEAAIEYAGRGAEWTAGKIDLSRGMGAEPDPAGYPLVRGAAEVATQFLPIERGAAALRKVVRPAAEPAGVDPSKGYGPEYDPNKPIDYVPGPSGDIQKTGTRDTTLTETQIPSVEFDKEGAYSYKNKSITDKLDQWDYRKGSDIPGIDFNTFSVEDPKQIADLQNKLKNLGIESDINQARTLATQMQEKMALADERAIGMSHTITKRIPPTALEEEKVVEGYKRINASPMNAHVELVDTRLMELMRDHDRLTEPKGRNQFLEKERSILDSGVHKGLTLWFWPEEGRIVQENGNSRRGIAAKHGLQEIPAYVRIMDGKVPEEWKRSAVSIPGLSWEGPRSGQFVKPSDIGLPSRTLNEGVFNPKIKYAPVPTVSDTINIPPYQFQNNHLFDIQHNELPQWGARKGLNVIRDTSVIPWYRAVAKLLLADEGFNPTFTIKEFGEYGKGKETTRGQFSQRKYDISVRKDATGSEYVFIHEAIHAQTSNLIDRLTHGQLDRMHPSYDATKRLVDLWQTLHTNVQVEAERPDLWYTKNKNLLSPLNRVIDQYGLTNAHEFVAEAFSNPEFQNLLKQISLPDHLQTKGFKYYWDAFVQALGDLIGIKRDQNNYLAATIQAGAEMMRTSTKQDRMFYALEQKPESWYPRNVGVEDGPDVVSGMIEAKKIQGIDRRPLQEVVDTGKWTAENIKDLDSGKTGNVFEMLWGKLHLLGRNLMEARTIERMNKEVPGAGDIMKNIGDRTFLTDRWVISQIAETMKGKELSIGSVPKILGGQRFVHRLGSRDGVDPTFATLGDKEGRGMLKKWLPSSGGKDDLSRSSFENDKQFNGYNILQNQVQRVHGILNDLRQKLGKPYIEPLKNYFPFSRPVGDYRVTMKDAMGNIRNVETFQRASPLGVLNGLYDANKFVAKMKEQFPYMEVSDPIHVDKDHLRDLDGRVLTELERAIKRMDTDYEVWAEAERINTSNHPLTQLIQKAKTDHFTRLGMGGHLIERKKGDQIGGYLGSDFDPKKAQEGLKQYFEYAYQYAGNLNKALIEKELNELQLPSKDGKTQTLAQAAPNLDKYLHQVMELSRGQRNTMDMSEQIFLGEFTQAIGEGASAPTRGMSKLSRFAMVWYLFKPAFFGTQPIQTANALAHLVDMGHSPVAAVGHFLSGVQATITPTAADKAGVYWAVKNGLIDPGTSHLLDDYNSSLPTRVFLKTTGTIEREGVRIPAFLMFEHALRDTIKDPEKRYEEAGNKMAYAMSMVNRSNQPLIWNKLGIIGQGMRQLKSYSTNIWGQFAYFTHVAADQGNFKPLGTFMGTGLLIGGIKGTIGVAEATALITGWNYMTNSNVPTPVEWWLKRGGNTGIAYGAASVATGRDISNQVGNPSGFNYLDPIPFKFAYDLAKQNLEYALAVGQDQLNDDIRLKTWLANTPPVLHEMIRNNFTKDGQPVPTPGMGMRGKYFREAAPLGMDIAGISGTRSIEETKADDLQRFFKQHEQRIVANKSQVQNSMVDDVMDGRGISPSKIQEYIRQGGDLHSLAGDLKNTLIERHRADIFNQVINKGKTPSHAQQLREVQPYLKNQPSNIYHQGGEPEVEFADE